MSVVTQAIGDFVSFFFVVDFGAGLAGYGGDQYVVLSSALLIAAAISAGGISPLGDLSDASASGRTRPLRRTTERLARIGFGRET